MDQLLDVTQEHESKWYILMFGKMSKNQGHQTWQRSITSFKCKICITEEVKKFCLYNCSDIWSKPFRASSKNISLFWHVFLSNNQD